jgi:hypothetical protein
MGSIIEAVIEHKLSPEEILLLPESLNKLNFINCDDDNWGWTAPNIDSAFLEKYWRKSPEDFMKEPWGIEDLAILEKGNLSIHFLTPHLASFDTLLGSSVYDINPATKCEFDVKAKSIALKMKPVDIIIIKDWYYDHAFDFDNNLTVEIIRQSVRHKNLSSHEINLKD